MNGEKATITLLLTDIEGSTKLWEKDPEFMAVALARHDEIARKTIEGAGGVLVKARGEGDSLFARFHAASDAVAAATALLQSLAECPETHRLSVRMAIHSGDAVLREGDYYGPTVNRCARIREIVQGGQIVLSGAAYGLCVGKLPASVTTVDHGLHRLRDLTRPERLYEVVIRGRHRDFAPLCGLDAVKHNLPLQPTTFIGRVSDVDAVKKIVGTARAVSLVGVGGCGKTRLALQAAADLIDSFVGGIWFVDLSAAEPDRVEEALLNAVGLEARGACDGVQRLALHFHGPPQLLILDNCERILDEVARIVVALVAQAPTLRILATSREPLGLKFEHVVRVTPLSLPEPGESSLDCVLSSEAAQMFEDRARMCEPGFRIDTGNAWHVASVCRRLDGLPLALELAAAQIDVLSPKQLDERLASARLDVRDYTRGEAPRHETMRAAIAWSYDGLDDSRKLLFAGLSVFAGSFTLQAVEAIFGPGVYDDFHALVRKSLVNVEDSASGKRYRLLETIRSFASEQASSTHAEVEERRSKWFAQIVVEASTELDGPHHAETMLRLAADYDDVRAALAWAESYAPSTLAQMCVTLGKFWHWRGMIREARRWLQAAVLLDDGSQPMVIAKLLRTLGVFCWRSRDYAEAESHLQDAFNRFVALNETAEAAAVRTNQGILAGMQNMREAAMAYQAESVVLHEKVGDTSGAAKARANLGVTLFLLKRHEEAAAALTQAMAVLGADREYARLANVKVNLADVRAEQHDPTAAHGLLLEAFDLLQDAPSAPFVGHGLLVAALTAVEARDLVSAAILLGAAEAEFERSEERMDDLETSDTRRVSDAVQSGLGSDEMHRLFSEGHSLGVVDAINRFRLMTGITTR